MLTPDPSSAAPLPSLPSALDEMGAVAERLADRTPAVFLDYDGTLTPIVDDPMAATLGDDARRVIRKLAGLCPVAIVSGRDRAVVRDFVAIDELIYAGSHGFDIVGPDLEHQHPKGIEAQPALGAAAAELDDELGSIPGSMVERKRYAVAVHLRRVDPSEHERIERAVRAAAERHSGLRVTTGKMIFELRPDVDWDKGKALRWLLTDLGLDRPDVVPLYIGDDDTDEDALRELRSGGIGVVVGTEDRPTLASYRVADPDEVVELLDRLADLLEAR
ncbi:MAG TPA: trehalose-phosphatase [Acidimicrobiales bacterium]|nr:trehalose-phosphatase [Acidimicrobiales bacterium]